MLSEQRAALRGLVSTILSCDRRRAS